METSLKAAEVLLSPQPSETASLDPEGLECEAAASLSSSSSSHTFDPIQEFSQRLEDIIRNHGSATVLLDTQSVTEAEMEKMDAVTMETDISAIRHCLDSLPSPEDKLEELVHKHAELAAQRRKDEQRLRNQQLQLEVLMEQRCSGLEARRKLEDLCRELQSHYSNLREEALQRSREDEEKRKEITSSFQEMLTEIQEQIHLHSARNDKLCRENSNLTDKLESLMNQCERREESLEKIGQHHDLQQKLTEAKLQQANALLAEAEDRHKREKEYLLREAIDKTKKCFAMKEQELSMKKKLTLYAQKFDEFQATLAKSNEIYIRFKKEMDNMSQKMKKMEKESDLWKMRFENCNKALTDMIEERTEKGKEYEMFVLKIQKLEKLCRALQDERKVLYNKIKEVRQSNSSIPLMVSGLVKGSEESTLLTSKEILDLEEEDPVLTEDMARLREEQAKLQDFAAALLDEPEDDEEQEEKSELCLEEDLVVSSFVQFKTKGLDKEGSEKVQNLAEPPPEPVETSSDSVLTHPDLELQTPAETQLPNRAEPGPEPEPEALKLEVLKEDVEVKPVLPVEDEKTQQQKPDEPAQVPIELTPHPPSTSSKKQVPKKKKRSSKPSS